jgi:hypothetical protein
MNRALRGLLIGALSGAVWGCCARMSDRGDSPSTWITCGPPALEGDAGDASADVVDAGDVVRLDASADVVDAGDVGAPGAGALCCANDAGSHPCELGGWYCGANAWACTAAPPFCAAGLACYLVEAGVWATVVPCGQVAP